MTELDPGDEIDRVIDFLVGRYGKAAEPGAAPGPSAAHLSAGHLSDAHIDPNDIVELVYGSMTALRAASANRHLQGCADCREAYDLEMEGGALSSFPRNEVPRKVMHDKGSVSRDEASTSSIVSRDEVPRNVIHEKRVRIPPGCDATTGDRGAGRVPPTPDTPDRRIEIRRFAPRRFWTSVAAAAVLVVGAGAILYTLFFRGVTGDSTLTDPAVLEARDRSLIAHLEATGSIEAQEPDAGHASQRSRLSDFLPITAADLKGQLDKVRYRQPVVRSLTGQLLTVIEPKGRVLPDRPRIVVDTDGLKGRVQIEIESVAGGTSLLTAEGETKGGIIEIPFPGARAALERGRSYVLKVGLVGDVDSSETETFEVAKGADVARMAEREALAHTLTNDGALRNFLVAHLYFRSELFTAARKALAGSGRYAETPYGRDLKDLIDGTLRIAKPRESGK